MQVTPSGRGLAAAIAVACLAVLAFALAGCDRAQLDHQLLLTVHEGKACTARKLEWLIFLGASVDVRSDTGSSALQGALSTGADACAMKLLDEGANPNAINKIKEGAVHSAVYARNWRVLVRLLRANVPPDTQDIQGVTPLMIAAYARNHSGIRMLLEAGADPCKKDVRGRTALDTYRRDAQSLEYPALNCNPPGKASGANR